MMRHILTYLTGVIFGTGIVLSGMSNPSKVLNFFDFAGIWDPSLAFVMGAAVVVAFIGYRFVLRRPKPVFEARFDIPASRTIDMRLIAGSAVFGVGWGVAGFCPGGAIPAVSTLNPSVLIFVASLIAGMLLARSIMRIGAARQSRAA